MQFKNSFIYGIGLLTLTFGIALMIKSNFGASPWDAVNVGISNISGLSIGSSNIVTSIFLVILIAIITKTKPKISVVLVGVAVGIFIDFWIQIVPVIEQYNFLIGILGITFLSLGIALYSNQGYPINPIDNFMISLNKKFNLSITVSKFITDGTGLIFAIVVGGPIGLGTGLMYVMLPFQIEFFTKLLKKIGP